MNVARFLAAVESLDGVPWHHQGRSRAGVDCAGLVLVALAEQGCAPDVPANYHTSAAGAVLHAVLDASPMLKPRQAATHQPGDLLCFRIRCEVQHLAVFIGADRMMHATRPAGVRAVTLSPLWRARITAVYGWTGG